MPASKADQATVLRRVEQAYIAILDGNTANATVAALMTEHGISQAQAYKYVKDAMDRIYQKSSRKFEEEFEKHYKRLERLYTLCMKSNDRRTANQVLKQMSSLFGLDAPQRTDITTGGEKLEPRIIDVFSDMAKHIVKPREVVEEHGSDDGDSDPGASADGEASPSPDGDTAESS